MRTRFVIWSLALLVVAACTHSRKPIELSYTYSKHDASRYTLRARAEADWDIGGGGIGSYDALYSVREVVESVDDSGAVVEVTMTSRRVSEDNLPAPARGRTSFRLRLAPDGSVLDVLEVNGAPARALGPDELVFIGTFRPPLPRGDVVPGDRWRASSGPDLGAVFRRVVTNGTLDEVATTPSATLAALSYAGGAPLIWTTPLAEGLAEMSGSADTRGRAIFDVERGRLNQARTATSGSFDVRLIPRGDGPALRGTLDLELELDLRRYGWTPVDERLDLER